MKAIKKATVTLLLIGFFLPALTFASTSTAFCQNIAAFGKTIPGGKTFCGTQLKKQIKTSIGTFFITTQNVKTYAGTYPNAPIITVAKDNLYFIKDDGSNVQIPLNVDGPIGGSWQPVISSIIDMNNLMLIIEYKNTTAISLLGIDLTKGSNSTPLTIDGGYQLFGGKNTIDPYPNGAPPISQ